MSPHVLIFGFGYTGHFVAKKARALHVNVTGTTRDQDALGYDAESDCEVIHFSEKSIERALATTSHILISTPPIHDMGDPVLITFGHLLKKYIKTIQWIGYLSSTSVYGDHQGNWVDESSEPKALEGPGQLRLSAENDWVSFTQTYDIPLNIFRLAGIYGPKRNALVRLMAGKKETVVKDGHFFSRIHVADIVSVILEAIQQSKPGVSVYNVADDEPTPGDVVDQYAASLLHLFPLNEVTYDRAVLSPMAHAFYSQNKRVLNTKLKDELNIQLMYPSYKEGLFALLHGEGD